eukprot:366566-Chlamydomonas_euryale.AAC.9
MTTTNNRCNVGAPSRLHEINRPTCASTCTQYVSRAGTFRCSHTTPRITRRYVAKKRMDAWRGGCTYG